MITPETVCAESRIRLETLYDVVIPVQTRSNISVGNLATIGRPDLFATLTKLSLWSLTQFSRVLYLDSDTLVLQNMDHLFTGLPRSVYFAAAPELGYPDTFNAGLMFLNPDQEVFEELCEFAQVNESYDGGDQGLLNAFFGDGTRNHPMKQVLAENDPAQQTRGKGQTSSARNWFRLSSIYNLEMHKVFRLNIPAALRYRNELKMVHFIGKDKPWHFPDGDLERPADANAYFDFYTEMVGRWWDVRKSLESA